MNIPRYFESLTEQASRLKTLLLVQVESNTTDTNVARVIDAAKPFRRIQNSLFIIDAMYPLVVSLSELMEVKSDKVVWKSDPDDFVTKNLATILKSGYQSIIRGQDYDPGKVGKERGAYQLVSNMYKVVDHL